MDIVLDKPSDSQMSNCTLGASVQLLSDSNTPVGTAVTISGEKVHGHKIPDGFIRVAVDKLNPGVTPLVKGSGSDEDLTSGCITAWPLKFTRQI